jgi:hypothetical protein
MNWEAIIAVSAVVGIVVEIVMGIALYLVNQKANRIDRLEETVSTDAQKAVKAEFELLAKDFQLALAPLSGEISFITERLRKGDHNFEVQGDAQRELEIRAEQHRAAMQKWAMDQFATRGDMEKLGEAVHRTELALASFRAECITRHQTPAFAGRKI